MLNFFHHIIFKLVTIFLCLLEFRDGFIFKSARTEDLCTLSIAIVVKNAPRPRTLCMCLALIGFGTLIKFQKGKQTHNWGQQEKKYQTLILAWSVLLQLRIRMVILGNYIY